MAGMTRRELAFLLIGLGIGLSLAVVFCVAILASLHSLGMIIAYSWRREVLAVPIALIVVGMTLILVKPEKKFG
jgi:hypothetical protein